MELLGFSSTEGNIVTSHCGFVCLTCGYVLFIKGQNIRTGDKLSQNSIQTGCNNNIEGKPLARFEGSR